MTLDAELLERILEVMHMPASPLSASPLSMLRVAAILLAFSSSAALAADPVTQPTLLEPEWQARTRAMLEAAVEIPTVARRGEMLRMAQLVVEQLNEGGFAESDIRIIPYEGLPGDQTVSLVFRWRAENPTRKPMLILGHMDVVEAKREDWEHDPFEFVLFSGRGYSGLQRRRQLVHLARR